jgi:hypothetical protein
VLQLTINSSVTKNKMGRFISLSFVQMY